MNNKKSTPMTHEEVQLLLPSYINGKLSSQQQRLLQEHTARCEVCFAAHQEAIDIKRALEKNTDVLDELLLPARMEQNLEQVLGNIDELEKRTSEPETVQQASQDSTNAGDDDNDSQNNDKPSDSNVVQLSSWGKTPAIFKQLMIGQAAAIVVGVAVFFSVLEQTEIDSGVIDGKTYRTLSDSTASSAGKNYSLYRVVFHPATTEGDIRSLLNTNKAQITSGPSLAGVYTIATLQGEEQQSLLLTSLRNSPWTKLVEPAIYKSSDRE